MPAWIPWRKHWNSYPDGKQRKKKFRRQEKACGIFLHFITKKCANAQKLVMDIEEG